MHRALLRAPYVIALAAIALTVGTWATAPSPVRAEDEPSRFVLTVFPQDTENVGFSNSWGSRRSGGRGHRGTDIIGPRGTEVFAAADGIVTALGNHRMSGYFIRIDHGDGWATTYMHLNNDTYGTDDGEGGVWTAFYPTLMEGDEVAAGQVIGYVGDSGNAEGTTPHTHFEVNHEGQKKNPYHYLTEVLEREVRLAPATSGPM
jgi:murein DD-endopeptidase MepM/ murein hydrolase activator NlpD